MRNFISFLLILAWPVTAAVADDNGTEAPSGWGLDTLGKGFTEILRGLAGSSVGTILSAVGVVFLGITAFAAYKAIKSDPAKVARWQKALLFASLVVSVLFSAAGPAVSLLRLAPTGTNSGRPQVSPAQALENLRVNKRVEWLIRLIAYDPATQTSLSISQLQRIGPPSQQFTFVADYNELRGHTVREAIRMLGGDACKWPASFRDHLSASRPASLPRECSWRPPGDSGG